MSDVPATAIRPINLNGIRFEAGRHNMQDWSTPVITSSFSRVVIHSKAETLKQGRVSSRKVQLNCLQSKRELS